MKRPKPLADLVGPILGPALARQGFADADILASWPEIVGPSLAAVSRPLRVEWPRRFPGGPERAEPATLVLRVTGAFALEAQHSAPLIIERVNAFYGWACIGRLVLKQGPVARPAARSRAVREPSEAQRRRVAEAVAGVAEAPLRSALERLGCAVAEAEARPVEAGASKSLPAGTPALS